MNLRRKLLAFLQSQKKNAEYTELEYLEGTGTQWIDTGVYPDSTYTFDTKVAVTEDNYNCVYWGTRSSGTVNTFDDQCFLNSNSSSTGNEIGKQITLYTTASHLETNWRSGIVPEKNVAYNLTGITVVPTINTMIYPISLFGLNNIGVVNSQLGKCRIYKWVAYSNNKLIADLIPVLDKDFVPCMYDKVSGRFLYNQGSGQFKWKLPNQLECLESDGNQYINLDYIPTENTGLHVKASTVGRGDMIICGSRNNTTTGTRLYLSSTYSSANQTVPLISIGRGNYLYLQLNGSLIVLSSDLTVPFNTVYEQYTNYKNSKVTRFVDSTRDITSVTIPELTFTPNQPLYLFAGNITGVANYAYKGKIYSCEITEGDKIVMYLIPAVDENLTPCMYDLVSKTYLYNQGTGSFKGYFEDGTQLVNYLSATGTQWIDTGITPLMGDELELKNVLCKKKGSGLQTVFSAGTGDYQTILLVADGTYKDRASFYKYFATGGAQNINPPNYLDNPTTIKIESDGSIYYNGEFIIQSPPVQETNSSMRLFYRANNASPMTGNIGAVSIKRDGNFVINLVPVVKSDNIACMLDLVSNKYFVNKGSGTFNYG